MILQSPFILLDFRFSTFSFGGVGLNVGISGSVSSSENNCIVSTASRVSSSLLVSSVGDFLFGYKKTTMILEKIETESSNEAWMKEQLKKQVHKSFRSRITKARRIKLTSCIIKMIYIVKDTMG